MRTGSFKVIFAGKMAIYAAVLPENSYKFQCYFDLEKIYWVKTQLCFNWAGWAVNVITQFLSTPFP